MTENIFVYSGIETPPTNVTRIVVKYGVREIPKNAFKKRRELKSIHIPDTVISIAPGAFLGCTGLVSVVLPSSVQEIGAFAFEDCSSLLTIHLPSTITQIGSGAFKRCRSLVSINLPSSITKIKDRTFCECESLTLISLPLSIGEICERAFDKCSSLTLIQQQQQQQQQRQQPQSSIENSAEESLRHSNFFLSKCLSSVTRINDHAFFNCESLTSIHLPSTMEYIGDGAFCGCSSLRSITLPSKIDYNNMRYVQFPLDEVFHGCKSVERIMIESSIAHVQTEVVYIIYGVIVENPVLAATPCTVESCRALHVLLMFGYTYFMPGAFEEIIEVSSCSLPLCDPIYNMFPFLLAACTPRQKNQNLPSLETIYVLLREAPWVMESLISNFKDKTTL